MQRGGKKGDEGAQATKPISLENIRMPEMPRMVASHFFLCLSMNRVFCTDADRDVRPGRDPG